MANFIDGFILPIPKASLDEYRTVADEVAKIWKDYGALSYYEYVGEDLMLNGTRSFVDALNLKDDEVAIFGWVVFPSREIRDSANAQVPQDERMHSLVAPLVNPDKLIFNAQRMFFGGFKALIEST